MAKIDWYDEFVDFSYKPAKDDLVCLYYFEPDTGMTTSRSTSLSGPAVPFPWDPKRIIFSGSNRFTIR